MNPQILRELTEEYLPIIEARLKYALQKEGLF